MKAQTVSYVNKVSIAKDGMARKFDCRTRSIYDFVSGSSWKTMQLAEETEH